jgi:hypothetical protein
MQNTGSRSSFDCVDRQSWHKRDSVSIALTEFDLDRPIPANLEANLCHHQIEGETQSNSEPNGHCPPAPSVGIPTPRIRRKGDNPATVYKRGVSIARVRSQCDSGFSNIQTNDRSGTIQLWRKQCAQIQQISVDKIVTKPDLSTLEFRNTEGDLIRVADFTYVPPRPAPVIRRIAGHHIAFIGMQPRAWSSLDSDERVILTTNTTSRMN